LNDRADPFPPPRTRSGCEGFVGATCFGAGNMDNKPDTPAPPPSVRAFFVGGCSGSPSASSVLLGFGRSIVIFFGRLVCFGGGREIPDLWAVVDFVGMDLAGAVVVAVVSTSESLPYPSTPSMTMMVDVSIGSLTVSRRVFRFTRRARVDLEQNNGDLPGTGTNPKEEQQIGFTPARLLTTSCSTPSSKTPCDSEHCPVQPTSYLSSHHSRTKHSPESHPR